MLLSMLIVGVVIQTLSLLPTVILVTPWTSRMSDYYNHPCKRECIDGARPMFCEYDFTVEYYYTLTQACHGCPYNHTDCARPHCIAADGVSRGVMTVNRMIPGPGIHVCLGDTIIVNVKNRMEGAEATTIHWHGILQTGSPHMDGVAMVTQCPIHSHSTFQYRFQAENAGTHYWHAHAGLQRSDGIFGALVVRQPRSMDYHGGLYNFDFADHTIIINDWLDENGAARFAGHHHAMTEHLPASILINGHGTYHSFGSEPPTPHGVHMMSHESHMAESHHSSKSHSEHQNFHHDHHNSNSENKHSNSEKKKSNGENKNAQSEHKSSNSEHKSSNSEHKSSNSESKSSNGEHKHFNNEHGNTNSEHKNSNSEHKNSNSEHKNSNNEHKNSNSEHKNSNSEHKNKNSEHKNSNNEHKNANGEHKNSNSEHKSTNSEQKTQNNENIMINSEHSMAHHMATMPIMGSVTKPPEILREGGHEPVIMDGNIHIPREGHVTAEALREHVTEGHVRSKRGTSEKKSGCDNKHGGENKKERAVHTPHAVFYVQQGYRYRFRIISNGVNNCPIHVSVDNHTLIVISSDGSPFRPVIVESFNIFAGERYDFVLVATNPVDNYWIRTRGLDDCGADYKAASQTAILRYIGAPDTNPRGCTEYKYADRKGRKLNSWTPDSINDLINVNQLESCEPNDVALKLVPDRRFYLAMDFNMIENYRFHDPELYPLSSMMAKGHHAHHMFTPQINHISFKTPSSPPLSQLGYTDYDFCDEDSLKLTKNCKIEFCECTHRLKVNVGDVVELVVIDEGKNMDNNHPMHLHGHNFRVIGMAKLNTSTSVEEVKMLDNHGRIYRNLNKAPIKDTVNVPDGGYTIIRFHAKNPGFWAFHCHIAFHMEMGMSLLIQVGNYHDMPRTPRNFPRCGDWTPETQRNNDIYCPPVPSFNTGPDNVPSTAEPHYISNFHPPPNLELPSGVNITGANLRNLMLLWLQGNSTTRSGFGPPPTTMRIPTSPTSRSMSMRPLLYDTEYVNTN